MKQYLMFLFMLFVLASCQSNQNSDSFEVKRVQLFDKAGMIEFEAPDYLDSSFITEPPLSKTCLDQATYLVNSKKDVVKDQNLVKNLLSSITINHSAIQQCGFNSKDSLNKLFEFLSNDSKRFPIHSSKEIDTENGAAYLVVRGEQGMGNAFALINRNGLTYRFTFLVYGLEVDPLMQELIRIIKSVKVR
jgi:hypothetical protein